MQLIQRLLLAHSRLAANVLQVKEELWLACLQQCLKQQTEGNNALKMIELHEKYRHTLFHSVVSNKVCQVLVLI